LGEKRAFFATLDTSCAGRELLVALNGTC
jgi:hypothetical protein